MLGCLAIQPADWSKLCFLPHPMVLNIAAMEGSFRLQPPPPHAGKSMPAPLAQQCLLTALWAAWQSKGLDCTQA